MPRLLRHRRTVIDLLLFAGVVALLAWLTARGSDRLEYNWQWYRVKDYLYKVVDGEFISGPLLQGLYMTFRITWISLLLSFGIGLLTALMRLSDSFVARLTARTYLELIRNTPLLIQIFFVYFVLSPLIGISAFTSAVVSLSLFEGAYASEIFRSGIVSIPKGQWEASYSLGLSTWQGYYRVILPQAVRRVLPPLTSIAVNLIKDSALVSTIAIAELTKQGQIIISETYLTFEIWFTVAAVYLCVTLAVSFAANLLERKLRIAA